MIDIYNKRGNMAYRMYLWIKNNPEKRTIQRRRHNVRTRLREIGILPLPGEPMNEEQQIIFDQIGNDDYSYWDSIKTRTNKNTKIQERTPIKTPEYLIWARARDNAITRKRDFDLLVEDIYIPEYCPYLGIKLSTDYFDRYNDNYYSVDRIDSNLGYVKGNIQIVSRLSNTMKNKSTKEELITFAKNILKMYGE